MTQAGSGAYLGGISTMLAQNDVCPSCGQVHEERRFSLHFGQARDCPLVVNGSFPTLSKGDWVGSLVSPTEDDRPMPRFGRAGSMLSVPWPMPTQPEDYL